MSHKRTIRTDDIKKAIIEMLYEANFRLSAPVKKIFNEMKSREKDELPVRAMEILCENFDIAEAEDIPLCQDCGAVIVFLEIGQDVALEGVDLYTSINRAIKEAYEGYYLRKSIVADPLQRKNTGTNEPGFIHTEIVPGNSLKITVYLKGGGSENMTSLKMFRPTASMEEIIEYIREHLVSAGPNPCPPLFLGIGIGGTADVALVNAKKAVLRGVDSVHENPFYAEMEKTIYDSLNSTGIGPLGFGGVSTVAGVYIREAPTHIATLPVALNLSCHSLRYREIIL